MTKDKDILISIELRIEILKKLRNETGNYEGFTTLINELEKKKSLLK